MILPVLIVPVLIVLVLLLCNSSDRLLLYFAYGFRLQPVYIECSRVDSILQFRQAVLSPVSGSKAFIFMRKTLRVRLYRSKSSIFVRKTLRVRPRDQKALAFLARREGPAFFDEDDACAGFRISVTARLNYYMASLSLFKRLNNL